MAKHKLETVQLTNMCMIMDESTKKVLVQVRNKNDWDGITFPGGKVEKGESIVLSVKREVKEETGLKIGHVIPCGIKDWYDFKKKERYIVFFYKTSDYSGTLLPASDEGENKWMSLEEIYASSTAPDFLEMLDIFTGKVKHTEFFYEDAFATDVGVSENDRWRKKFY